MNSAGKVHFVIDPSRSSGAVGSQTRAELMQTPNTVLQRPSTKQIFLSSRNDNFQERNARFGRLIAKHASRPLQFSCRLSSPIHHPLSMKALQFVLPMDQLYNVHSHYANDTLLIYRADRQSTQIVTVPPGNYTVEDLVSAVNAAIEDSWLSFFFDLVRNRIQVQAGEGNGTPGIIFAQQFGGLAEMLGFAPNEHYDPQTGLMLFPASTYYADSPPKLWTFEEVFLHVDDHVGAGRNLGSTNELTVANTENNLDQIFQFYQGANSAESIVLQTAAPKGFALACASTSLAGNAPYQSLALHNNNSLEGSFLERQYTHQTAQQYNNLIIEQITVSFTNEYGQLIVVSPTTEVSVKLQFTTAH